MLQSPHHPCSPPLDSLQKRQSLLSKSKETKSTFKAWSANLHQRPAPCPFSLFRPESPTGNTVLPPQRGAAASSEPGRAPGPVRLSVHPRSPTGVRPSVCGSPAATAAPAPWHYWGHTRAHRQQKRLSKCSNGSIFVRWICGVFFKKATTWEQTVSPRY